MQKGKILKYHINPYGYYQVRLSKNGIAKTYKVHKLIAITFIENIHNKPTVNHKNGNKLDNNITNLEWATRSEQTRHMHEVLGYPYRKGIDLARDRWKNHVKGSKKKPILPQEDEI